VFRKPRLRKATEAAQGARKPCFGVRRINHNRQGQFAIPAASQSGGTP
jgi:hypothetical protein